MSFDQKPNKTLKFHFICHYFYCSSNTLFSCSQIHQLYKRIKTRNTNPLTPGVFPKKMYFESFLTF